MAGKDALHTVARELMSPGKGLLAADESETTMFARLKSVGVAETDAMQKSYRTMLFSAPLIEQYLSGVILFDSSMRDTTADGVPFPDLLAARGIIPGIKVDRGTVPFLGFPGEVVTEGLDGLGARLADYYVQGARFSKWRAVFTISDTIPTDAAITANAFLLARYASLAQEAGLVPIVEPEVIMHGDHSRVRAEEVTMRVLQVLFATLREYRVDISALILKSSMVIAGDGYRTQTSPQEVADATLRTFHLSVPHEVAGIVFLSGGQTPKRATENLQAIASMGEQPWPITFSYSRAIEEPVLATWRGESSHTDKAQAVLLERCRQNSLAAQGSYQPDKDPV